MTFLATLGVQMGCFSRGVFLCSSLTCGFKKASKNRFIRIARNVILGQNQTSGLQSGEIFSLFSSWRISFALLMQKTLPELNPEEI
jgi:hypothetical protein